MRLLPIWSRNARSDSVTWSTERACWYMRRSCDSKSIPIPETSGSVSGGLHRAWVDIKSTITRMDEAAVLAECQRGEDVAGQAYEEALAKDLPADIRSVVARQYEGVRQHQDRVRRLRNSVS